jgi:hypothetical protein
MTTSTFGMSSPLAATSVVRRTEGEDGTGTADEKASRVRVLAAGEMFPWRE